MEKIFALAKAFRALPQIEIKGQLERTFRAKEEPKIAGLLGNPRGEVPGSKVFVRDGKAIYRTVWQRCLGGSSRVRTF